MAETLTTTVENLPTKDLILKDHPVIAHIPAWGDEDARFLALYDSVEAHGFLDPIRITPDRRIVDPDSRERWHVAKRLQRTEVPVRMVEAEAVATTCLALMIHRKHYTKGALAYLVYPILAPALEESRARKVKMLKKGNVSPSSAQRTTGNSVDEIGGNLGIGRTMIFQAQQIHDAFAKQPELREKFETPIVEGEIGLGACIAGIAGASATVGKTPQVAHQLDLFDQIGHQFAIRAGYLTSMDANQRIKAKQSLTSHFSQLDEDVLDLVIDAAKAARKTAATKVA